MLNAAMERKYSGSPREKFFTGGGVHTFVNFEPSEDGIQIGEGRPSGIPSTWSSSA